MVILPVSVHTPIDKEATREFELQCCNLWGFGFHDLFNLRRMFLVARINFLYLDR